VPRLKRWKAMANNDFLPLFGATAQGLEFDYVSPVSEDETAENEERTSKANSAKTYIDAGFTAASVVEALDLPATLVWEKPEPPPAPVVAPPADAPAQEPDQAGGDRAATADPKASLLYQMVAGSRARLAEERHRNDDRPDDRPFPGGGYWI